MLTLYRNNKGALRFTALMLAHCLAFQLCAPLVSYGLTSGPAQPEIQSFEPVGTTDLVDPFTGDFTYNIPLMDVEGYPVNIFYHSGPTMEQEASWVGLGWNINTGCINRAVRGLPDDFRGEEIEKQIHIKPEKTTKIGLGAGWEIMGGGEPKIGLGLNLGGTLTFNNYRGVAVDFNTSAGVNTSFNMVNAGVNVGASVGSQSGGSVNYGATVGLGLSKSINDGLEVSGSFNLNTGGVYSPRGGLRRDVGFGISAGTKAKNADGKYYRTQNSLSTGTSVPIGLQSYTAVVSNATYSNTYAGRLKVGGEIWGGYGTVSVHGSKTKTSFETEGTRKGYGYLYLDSAGEQDILDFSREKDGMFNTTMHYLSPAATTYDIYSVSGQGTGGSFRPFRNDYANTVYDPVTKSESSDKSFEVELGLGNLFEAGGEGNFIENKSASGPWQDYQRPYVGKQSDAFEDVYFKEAGELTENDSLHLQAIRGKSVITPSQTRNAPLPKAGSGARVARSSHIAILKADDRDSAAWTDTKSIVSLNDSTGFKNYPNISRTQISRLSAAGSSKLRRRANHVTEIVQTQKDGRRYVYGIPVVNNVQREVTFAIPDGQSANRGRGLTGYRKGIDDKPGNGNGNDHFYSSTVTPTYTTSHLLTQVLSSDYSDVTGDGLSDDDIGSYTKFNYSRKSADYRWRAPLQEDSAQYIPGYVTDTRDDKASYMIGSREQWMLHSIETKNYIAEFYTSQRKDGRGLKAKITDGNSPKYNEAPYNNPLSEGAASYKLDSIVLYNKHDRIINKSKATPIKTVSFDYDYSLCTGVPNSLDTTLGKLTLRGISVRHADSKLGVTSPYRFTYSDFNPTYNSVRRDRWGYYKSDSGEVMNNFEYPFVNQAANNNEWSSAWSLTKIDLPSGGTIEVEYEADDYAYVETKKAMEMFLVTGMGSTTSFQSGNQLYFSPNQPNLYLYFKRRLTAEKSNLGFKENYLPETDLLYYNVPVELREGKGFEPIKGYARVKSIGACSDNIHGYIELEAQALQGSSYKVNPIAYTALNVGRYSLPHILFPGQDYDNTDMDNITKGLGTGIKELFQLHRNPLENLMKEDKAKNTMVNKAFVRLGSPGLKKVGGGQRVKTLKFYDNWKRQVGGNAQNAEYGKNYYYTKQSEDGKGEISSGVASYEPLMGGDEIPQRVPVGYTVQAGTNFPPNDPVNLFQEMPLGESFYPAPVVGYSKVTTRSIHQLDGQSAQSEQVENFYTARDFPVEVQASPLNSNKSLRFKITGINVTQDATQGFSIVLNDMHGKPQSVQNYVIKPQNSKRELVNSKSYQYQMSGGKLDNSVNTYQYNGQEIKTGMRTLGYETELTLDSRMRSDKSQSKQLSINANGFSFFIPPILVIPLIYPWGIENNSEFKMATATKIIQQYGIMTKVVNNNEGAITDVRNEVFDPQTGMPVLTSVNNEFGDREYSVSYPAYWAYKTLGPAYANWGIEGKFSNVSIVTSSTINLQNFHGLLSSGYSLASNFPVAKASLSSGSLDQFRVGDELLVTLSPTQQPLRVWVMGFSIETKACYVVFAPREPFVNNNGWVPTGSTTYSNASFRIVRSGSKNRLTESVQSITTLNPQNFLPKLKDTSLTEVISIKAQTYDQNRTVVSATGAAVDSLNPLVTGRVGIFRPVKEWLMLTNRDYATPTLRKSGLVKTDVYWDVYKTGAMCNGMGPLFFSRLGTDIHRTRPAHANWMWLSNSTKYNQMGAELEQEIRGLGYNAAVYGYGHTLPIAVGKNTTHGSALYESFDDMAGQLQPITSLYPSFLKFLYSPFQQQFSRLTAIGTGSPYSIIDTNGTATPVQYKLTATDAHTGYYALQVNNALSVALPIKNRPITSGSGITAPYSFFIEATGSKKYIANVWVKPTTGWTNLLTGYTPTITLTCGMATATFTAKTGIIEGWQQFEVAITPPSSATSASLSLPSGFLYDDFKLYASDANIKGFVYHPYTRKLMATLDENNYATLYEYDEEGNLVRTKRETEKGILTISESRNANPTGN